MKRIVHYTLLFVVIIFAAASCKKSAPNQTKYIPKDAMFVFDMDWKSLSEKAAKGNINWDSLFKSVADEGDDSAIAQGRKLMEDFKNSGVDMESNLFFFLKIGGSMMNGQSATGGIVAGMKDAGMFENYIKKQPGAGEIKKESNYSYISIGNDFTVGWNKDVVILSGSGMQGGSATAPASNTAPQTLAALFSQKEEESVAAIPEFLDLMTEKADMLVWTNSGTMMNAVPLLGLTKFADLLKDSFGAGAINFEDGKLVGNFKSYSGKDLADIWKKYAGPTVNMDMVNQYPTPLTGFAAFSFNPEIIKEIIKFGGMEATANQYMQQMGFTLDDITKAFKGDFVIAFSDFGIKETENDYGGMKYKSKTPVGKLVFNATIGDKAAYDKIVAKLAEMGEMEMKNGQYVPKGMGDYISWNMNGKNLVVATDTELMQQYLAAKGNAAVPEDVASQSKGKSIAFYFDINKILQAIPADSAYLQTSESAKATFKNVIVTSDNFNGKYVGSNFELRTMNDKENSLVTLVKFISQAAKQAAEEEKRYSMGGMSDMDMSAMDTTQMVMPPVEEPAK
ncbi:MAG TPA: DUF4836 family protein [Panacibacter sp.]|nr:DUF4836 family protein [Panacibacter sp.]